MARTRPELTEEQLRALPSRAEATLYRALATQLPNEVLVLHSARWLYRSPADVLVEGEADFAVFLPKSGFLTIEVKGGGVAYDGRTGTWSSVDRAGLMHMIKDPFRQAAKQRHVILDQLRGHALWRRWTGQRVHCGHAVFFPDLQSAASLAGMDRPIEVIGILQDLQRATAWIERVLHFWQQSNTDPLGTLGVDLAEQILCGSIEVRPLLAVQLAHEEALRVRLTDQQARVLRIIGGRARALIGGGAGTGKTLIALEKARRVALGGGRSLLICYNRRLADVLAESHTDIKGMEVLGYHQLCESRVA
jgi:hypothetical protein